VIILSSSRLGVKGCNASMLFFVPDKPWCDSFFVRGALSVVLQPRCRSRFCGKSGFRGERINCLMTFRRLVDNFAKTSEKHVIKHKEFQSMMTEHQLQF